MQALSVAHGIGKKKLKDYGDDIVDIVREYCVEIGKEFDSEPTLVIQEKKSKKASNTREISLQMFKNGLDIKEIAKERSLTVGTILGHLLDKIDENEINIEDLMEKSKMQEIEEAIQRTEFETLSELYQKLDKKYNYEELKVVLKKMGEL